MSSTLDVRRSTAQRPEASLVDDARRGDDLAFGELYSRYRPRIHAFILSRVHDHGRAEDISQEVFMSALRQLRASDQEIALQPWLYTIAKNACVDEFRRGSRGGAVPVGSDDDLSVGRGPMLSLVPTPDDAVESRQRLDDLRGAFGGLSETHRRLLVMREFEGLSYDEIGDRLDMSRQMVESGLFRARRKLGAEYDELASGRRCGQIVDAIGTGMLATVKGIGVKERRRVQRHLSHCESCRHHALVAGVDESLLKPQSIADKLAALLPFGLVRKLWPHGGGGGGAGGAGTAAGGVKAAGAVGGAVGSSAAAGSSFSLGTAAVAAAVVAIAGAGGGVVLSQHHSSHTNPTPAHTSRPATDRGGSHSAGAHGNKAGHRATVTKHHARASAKRDHATRGPVHGRHGLHAAGTNTAKLSGSRSTGGGSGAGDHRTGGGSGHGGTGGGDKSTGGGGSSGGGSNKGPSGGGGSSGGGASSGGSSSGGGDKASVGAGGSGSKSTGSVGGTVSQTGGSVGSVVQKTGGTVGGTVSQTSHTVGGVVQNTGGAVGSTVSQTGSSVGTVVQNTGDTVGGVVDKVAPGTGSVVTGVTDTAGGAVSQTGSAVGQTVTGVTNTAGGAVSQTGGAVGGVVGGVTKVVGGVLGAK